MKITLLAHTQLAESTYSSALDDDESTVMDDLLPISEDDYLDVKRSFSGDVKSFDHAVTDAERLVEYAGRLCYKSFARPNPRTRKNADYIANIIAQRHFSVLEHASATFLVEDVSRSLTHELVRHRHLSYSQVSQRYVNHSGAQIVLPPALYNLRLDAFEEVDSVLADLAEHADEAYEQIFSMLSSAGVDRKSARGAARAALLESTSTDIVVSGNMRAWRDVIEKRNSEHADAEIRALAAALLEELLVIAPAMFQDMR